jgi:arginase
MQEAGDLRVFYPHWQGAGHDDTVHRGAIVLRAHLKMTHGLELVDIEINESTDSKSDVGTGILNAAAIVMNHQEACKVFEVRRPTRIFTLGGDCGMELAPVGWLNTQRQDFAVVWFDAHADMNSAESSPSKTFHGQVLRNLLEGKDVEQMQAFPRIDPNRLILAGVRDLDPPEATYISEHNVTILSCDEIAETNGQCLVDLIAQRGYSRAYVHIDPDVIHLDDFDCTSCPTPNGIRIDALQHAIKQLRLNTDVLGGSLQEVTAGIEDKPAVKERLCRLFALLTGHES